MPRSAYVVHEVGDNQRACWSVDEHAFIQSKAVDTQLIDDAGKAPDVHSTGSLYHYVAPRENAVKPAGEWNTIEVVCDGDKITNIVNGVVVNEGSHASVTKGRILLQSEGAEVYYRKVELRPLDSSK